MINKKTNSSIRKGFFIIKKLQRSPCILLFCNVVPRFETIGIKVRKKY